MSECPVCGQGVERTIEHAGESIYIHQAAPTGAIYDYCIEYTDGRTVSTKEPIVNPHIPDEYREKI